MVIAFFLTVLIFLSWVSRVKKMAKNYTYSETLHASLILTIFQITSTIFFWGIIAKKLDIDRILLTNVFVALLVTKGRLWIVLDECFMLLKHVKKILRHIFSYRLLPRKGNRSLRAGSHRENELLNKNSESIEFLDTAFFQKHNIYRDLPIFWLRSSYAFCLYAP